VKLQRSHAVWASVFAALAAGVLITDEWRRDADSSLRRAEADAAAVEHLAGDLKSLSSSAQEPSQAAAGESELAARAQEAARKAGMAPESIVRIWPVGVRRMDRSDFIERPTQLILQKSSLPQTATFLLELTWTLPGSTVSELRLTAPHGDTNEKLWSVEATVSTLVYSPESRSATTPAHSSGASQR
jgi:hypothetical protein